MHDAAYKLLFSDRRVVADLLRGFVPSAVADTLDLSTLDRLSAEYVGEDLRRGTGDMLWQVRSREPAGRGGAPAALLVLLEFQSSVDLAMATRMQSYTHLVHRRRLGEGRQHKGDRHPPVLPVVLYNGERRWTAAVEVRETVGPVEEALAPYQPSQRYVLVDAGALGVEDLPAGNRVSALVELENSATAAALAEKLREVFERFGGLEDRGFREALYEWARHMPLMREGGELPGREELEGGDMATLLEARARQWEAQWLQEGIAQGIERGIKQGIERGRAEGRTEERALLCRQAARKFGAGTGERLTGLLDGLTDPERLAEVGEWLIECETEAELLGRVKQGRDSS